MKYAAFLRGINVGGKHKLPMADLRELFEDCGAEDVASYVQSGNIAFKAPSKSVRKIVNDVADGIEAGFGFAAPILVRSASELAKVIDESPFLANGVDDKAFHVGFFSTKARPAAIKALDPNRSPGDKFAITGKELYLWLPNGVARTKLTNTWFDSQLGLITTIRNWRTLNAMIKLTTP